MREKWRCRKGVWVSFSHRHVLRTRTHEIVTPRRLLRPHYSLCTRVADGHGIPKHAGHDKHGSGNPEEPQRRLHWTFWAYLEYYMEEMPRSGKLYRPRWSFSHCDWSIFDLIDYYLYISLVVGISWKMMYSFEPLCRFSKGIVLFYRIWQRCIYILPT